MSPPTIVIIAACCSVAMSVRNFWEIAKKKRAEQEINEKARIIYCNLREARRYGLMSDDEYRYWYYKYLVATAEKDG